MKSSVGESNATTTGDTQILFLAVNPLKVNIKPINYERVADAWSDYSSNRSHIGSISKSSHIFS